jgi:hypothetical protein
MSIVYLKKFANAYIWKRLFYERLTEPLHMNALSILVACFGSLRQKIDFDLVIRQQHAYALLNAADQAKRLGYKRVSVFEFGVAAGAGLLNIQALAGRIEATTGIGFNIFGFDTGAGMPPPTSYKDHPELYQTGDFPMNRDSLSKKLTGNTRLILGQLSETIAKFLSMDFSDAPIGFISIDVDYYSSTVDALALLRHSASNFLPRVIMYLDDLEDLSHNTRCGEQAAVAEFSNSNPMRLIEKHAFLRGYRLFRNARWIDHIYQCHVLDHPIRNDLTPAREKVVLTNPYI